MPKKSYKKIRKKMIKNYDKNNDGIISIDEYLAKEISKGPKEKKGKINYHYQNLSNVFEYFSLMSLKKIKLFKVMCIPKFDLKYKYNNMRATAIFDTTNGDYYFPDKMKTAIKKCAKKNNVRIVYFTLSLIVDDGDLMHANIVLIDLKKKTIERFEPHGCASIYKPSYVNTFFKKYVLKMFKMKQYIPPSKISSKVGIQKIADAYDGMCVTISMMYLQMRIMNLNLPPKKIVEHFTKMNKKKLIKIILKYAKYIENVLKNNDS